MADDESTLEEIGRDEAEPEMGHYRHLDEAHRHMDEIVAHAAGDPEVAAIVEEAKHLLAFAAEFAGNYSE